jgi:hypothetical protein
MQDVARQPLNFSQRDICQCAKKAQQTPWRLPARISAFQANKKPQILSLLDRNEDAGINSNRGGLPMAKHL